MSKDEKDSAASEGRDDAHIDRDDDDFGDFFTDGDDPSPEREDSTPDPGYAAFAGDFEDPLADWPGPDPFVELNDKSSSAPADDKPPQDDEEAAPAEAADDALRRELAFPQDNDYDDPGARATVDFDDEFERAAASNHGSDERLPLDDARDDTADAGDDIVDDFLDNLDEPVHPKDTGDRETVDAPRPAIVAHPGATAAAAVAAGSPGQQWSADRDEVGAAEIGGNASRGGRARGPAPSVQLGEDDGRRFSLLMIAVLLCALVLLALGGFGVVKQRETMEAEIRDLQARLATAMTPDESSSARETLRKLEVENERLGDELFALRGKTERLEDELATAVAATLAADTALSASLEADAAADAAAAGAGDGPATGPSADSQTAGDSAAAVVADAVSTGGEAWFVNFGSYTQRKVADQWAEKLEVAAGTVTVQSAATGGRTVYRVRVIGLPDRDTAERIATGLERSFQLPRLWIGRQ